MELNGKYFLSQYTKNNYLHEIEKLSIYNKEPEIIYSLSDRAEENKYATTTNDDIDQAQVLRSWGYDINSSKFIHENNRIPEPTSSTSSKYKTNPRIAKTAIIQADFKCELNPDDHETFPSKIGRPFMEAHHLIPMCAQKDFNINLDRIENIICICPNCHSGIHLGNDSTRLEYLQKIYNNRINRLRAVGINISFGDLYTKYYQ